MTAPRPSTTASGEPRADGGPGPESALASPLFREPDWDWAPAGDVGWWVRPSWRSRLLGPGGLRLDDWRSAGALSTVKSGPQRVVYRVDLPGGGVFVKHFLVPGYREMIRQWFRRGKGRNEAKRAAKLAAIGVPTILPIALGEQRRRRFLFENYLVTAEIAGSMPLDSFLEVHLGALPAPRAARLRRRIAEALADLTARLHEAGFVHIDFHPGNVLVRLDADDRPRLAMIDLDALRVRKSIGWRESRENLALLNHYFWTRCHRSDRLRFVRAYLAARRSPPDDPRGFARAIEVSTRLWAERLWRRWGRRCRGTNKYFHARKAGRSWGVASRLLDPAVLDRLLRDPDAPFNSPGTKILKSSRTTTVAEVALTVDGVPTKVVYKRFNRKKRLDPLLCLFRPSRAWRAWHAAQDLASRAVPSPTNLAVIAKMGKDRRWLPWQRLPRETYLATVKVEPSITLGDYALKVLPTLDDAARRDAIRRLIPALAGVLRTLHDRSLSHRDLKASNILIEGDPRAERPVLSLIDLVAVDLRFPTPKSRIIQNLARLQVSLARVPGRTRTDGLRFLRAYLPGEELGGPAWKALWRSIARRCRAKESRNRRRGRPLS